MVLLLVYYVTMLQTIREVYQANGTIVTANITILSALVLVLQKQTFHSFHVFLFFLLKIMIFASVL